MAVAFPSSTSTTSWNRARRAEAERAALRGHEGRERARPRHMGRRAGGRARAAGRRLHRPEDAHERLAGTRLENLLTGFGRDTIIVTGAWTNMSIEHTSRTGADKGYFMVVPEDGCSTMNADWHNASINYALQNVSTVTTCGAADGGARRSSRRRLARTCGWPPAAPAVTRSQAVLDATAECSDSGGTGCPDRTSA